MNRVINWLQNAVACAIATAFIVVISFSLGGMLGGDKAFQAQATPITTEYNSAEVKGADRVNTTDAKQLKEKAREATEDIRQAAKEGKPSAQAPGKNLVENVLEKLNLDEPPPPSTKNLNSTENIVETTVEKTKEGLQDAAEQVTGKPAY